MEIKLGDAVLVRHYSMYNQQMIKTYISRITPSGQIVTAKDNIRFKLWGNRYKCVSGENCTIEKYDSAKWADYLKDLEYERLKADVYNNLPKFCRTASVEQLRRIQAIMTETISNNKEAKK